MTHIDRDIQSSSEFPINEDLSEYAPPHTPEQFTDEESKLLKPFFSNLNDPVFIVKNVPPEVSGALASRYSRCDGNLRRVFLKEYVLPKVEPEKQKDWETLSPEDKEEVLEAKEGFLEMVDFFNSDKSPDKVANLKRARKFFGTWLDQYGDDSIAEMANLLLCVEGASNITVNIIEGQRIGVSPLEKSTRYVPFWEKREDGTFQYVVPGEIKGTPLEEEYKHVQDLLFETYAQLAEPYQKYIEEKYPITIVKGVPETQASFEKSRGAKRFDDLRDLLPFATQTSLALNGNGRAFEQMITRLLAHSSGEVRWWGQQICHELNGEVPSFMKRPQTERGAQMQQYRQNVQELGKVIAQELNLPDAQYQPGQWATLISSTPDADIAVLSAYLFQSSHASFTNIHEHIRNLSGEDRGEMLNRILEERKVGIEDDPSRDKMRFRKPPRAFEVAHFLLELWGRGGDYRDLHRHRMVSESRQPFTTQWGYELDQDVIESPFLGQIQDTMASAAVFYEKLLEVSPQAAEYIVPFGFIQHWFAEMSAREIFWMGELRTGQQGRPHYREICQQIADEAISAQPSLFQGIKIDRNNYRLARRASAMKEEQKAQIRVKKIEKEIYSAS